jgi:hypothetical protein
MQVLYERYAAGSVREMRPHLFASSDRSRDLTRFVFVSSDRTRRRPCRSRASEGFDKGRGPVGLPPPGRLLTCPHCPVRVPARVPLSNPGTRARPARQPRWVRSLLASTVPTRTSRARSKLTNICGPNSRTKPRGGRRGQGRDRGGGPVPGRMAGRRSSARSRRSTGCCGRRPGGWSRWG